MLLLVILLIQFVLYIDIIGHIFKENAKKIKKITIIFKNGKYCLKQECYNRDPVNAN